MARSRRKFVPVKNGDDCSMKKWKQKVNRKFRHKTKNLISREGPLCDLPLRLREVEDLWSSPIDSDKNRIWYDATEEYYRK